MAASRRRLVVQRARRDDGTCPTWEETSCSRWLWKAPPRDASTAAGPVPAHLDDPGFEARACKRRAQPLCRGRGVEHDIGVAGRVVGFSE